MAEDKVFISRENGKKKVKLTNEGFGLDLYTMRNGYQWTGMGVDIELLRMLKDVITEYLESEEIE